MPFVSDDIDQMIAALHAIKLVRGCYASSRDGVDRIDDMLDTLAKNQPPHSPRRKIADTLGGIYGSGSTKP